METILFLQETLILDQIVYAAGAALARGRTADTSADFEAASLTGEAAQSLAAEWRSLEARCPRAGTAFQSCDLVLAWARHFTDARTELRLVTVHSHGELVLVWPLAVERTLLGKTAFWAGDPIGQYGDVVAPESAMRDSWIDAAFAEIGRWDDVDFLCLRGVRADGAIAGWAARKGREIAPATGAPSFDAAPFGDAAAFEAARWPELKRNRRRAKKLGEMGDIRFEVVTAGPQAAALVARAFAFKRDWLAERGFYGRALIDTRTEACLAALACDTEAACGLAVSHLAIGGESAAIEIGFRHGGRHYAYMGAFSPAFAKHGPGVLATEFTIRDCLAAGLSEYDPLPPVSDYKLAWSNRRVAVRDYGVVLSWPGYAALASAALIRPAAKKLYEKLPLSLRRSLRGTES
jgi:CelD/BcsL family acetyltransferase involved in cellulose biosynthesis